MYTYNLSHVYAFVHASVPDTAIGYCYTRDNLHNVHGYTHVYGWVGMLSIAKGNILGTLPESKSLVIPYEGANWAGIFGWPTLSEWYSPSTPLTAPPTL